MNIFPDEVNQVIDDAVRQYPDDIDTAVDVAVEDIMSLPCFKNIRNDLFRSAIRSLIHDKRHSINVSIKHAASKYGGPAKVKYASSEAVNRVSASCYDYSIGSRSLGSMTGVELLEVRESELAIAKGHQVNATLCERLSKIVPPEKTVRESVTEKKLWQIFQNLGLKVTESKPAPKTARVPEVVAGRA